MSQYKSLLTELSEALDRYRTQRPLVTTSRPPRWQWFLPNGGTILLVTLLIVTSSIWAAPLLDTQTTVPGALATTINYQGRLADDAGIPINGTVGMSFEIYDALTGGVLVWGPENHPAVPVNDGLFNVGLGSQTGGGIPTNVWDEDRYLQITVSGEILTPREPIRSVPIAGIALTVPDGAISADKLHPELKRAYFFNAGTSGLVTLSGTMIVPFSETEDPENLFDNNHFVAPRSGYYFFNTTISFDGGDGTDDTYNFAFVQNTTRINSLSINPRVWTRDGREATESNAAVIYLNVGDSLSVEISDVNPHNVRMGTRSFSGFFLGE